MKKLFIFAAAAAGVAGLFYINLQSAGAITVTAYNGSGKTIRELVIRVTDTSYPVGDIAPGASATVKVRPSGDTRVTLEIDGRVRAILDTPIERGSEGSIALEFTPSGAVNFSTSLKPGGEVY
ncbi:hypothetical protein ACLB1G_03795 [Oxalobacteraceae bacterium A2-2]